MSASLVLFKLYQKPTKIQLKWKKNLPKFDTLGFTWDAFVLLFRKCVFGKS